MLLQIAGYLFIVAVIVIGVMVLINKATGRAWYHLFRTKVGQAGDYAEGIDPAGQMKQAALDAAAELKGADDALVECDKLRSKMLRQIKADELSVARLRGEIKRKLTVENLPDNHPVVVEKAKQVKTLEANIAENNSQITLQETVYKTTLANANSAAAKVQGAMARADRMKVRLDLGAQTVKLTSMLAKYDPTAVNSKMASIDKYEEKGNEALDGQQAQLKVMADRGMLEVPDPAADAAEVADVLADIRKNG